MSANSLAGDSKGPKRPPASSLSFSRLEDSSVSHPRTRPQTLQSSAGKQAGQLDSHLTTLEPMPYDGEETGDIFEKRNSMDSTEEPNPRELDSSMSNSQHLPELFDELPIELISLTDRFIDSLSAKIYSTPPTIDTLSELFQDFYARAGTHIATHVSILASRLNREISPAPSAQASLKTKRSRSSNLVTQKDNQNNSEQPGTDQQMLTASEVTEKRKARKLLQYKGHLLEEAVERRACESIYEKIWRHKSTLDEVKDEKLRSKTAALQLMGITLKDLGIEMPSSGAENGPDGGDWLSDARQSLMNMNDEKYPLGKLQHLIASHKAIVDSLTKILPSSSSADEILPILIYALITCPPEGINIISNLYFIQRFRSSKKLDGEAAYCLTNLEAAVSFLENVELSNLRGDNAEGIALKSFSESSSPMPVSHDPLGANQQDSSETSSLSVGSRPERSQSATNVTPSGSVRRNTGPDPSPQRRLTNLFQPPAKALGAANDVVRNTADQGIKNISSTLDNSFNFFFGRLKEAQMRQAGGTERAVSLVPKTLDDARRLVNPTTTDMDDGSTMSEDGSIKDPLDGTARNSPGLSQGDKLIGLISGRKPTVDRALDVDGKKPISANAEIASSSSPATTPSSSSLPTNLSQASSNTPFGSMRNFGNSLNPLNHIPGMIRGLGRGPAEASPGVLTPTSGTTPRPESKEARQSIANVSRDNAEGAIKPPIKRFLEIEDAAELRLADIPELLDDYKRLALLLENLNTF